MDMKELFRRVCNDNEDAVLFLMTIVPVLHVWDDLVDRDHYVTNETINAAFWDALVTLPRNPFYREYFNDLNPILVTAIVNWKAATAMERTNKESEVSFIIRSSYVDLVTMCAVLCGGAAHADALTPAIREFAHSEGYPGYIENLGIERNARGAT